ncbi:uncharacterized protein KRP23_3850 [Phytophthora ramorum]|uniref:uncharacterized protein n=1 Tax=Phytophthora ramorum TaxID=164328 RepID=UPI0030B2D3B3|nr:hypothetical protein KRP23_3850 [Phytophthora ramorum]KAH7507814.1 hypothetical protein KRP22_2909 [Phytophthora ramorum]
MEEERSYDSDESPSSPWQDRVRRGLVSDNVRLRLSTYSMLSSKCSESKEAQKHVGQLFGGPRSGGVSCLAGSSLMKVLFDDLRSTDRTLRIAAARVLCLMAYENLTNQQLIIRSQAGGDEEQLGVTVGWVHAFAAPQSLRDRYEAHCEERGLFTTPSGLIEFVSNLIKDNYASVYNRIGRYYADGCREFVPLCWFHPLVNDSSEATDMLDVPDPDENLVGFYLVPRQMQFPEQDGYFLQEILSSIRTEAELARLQQVQAAFQQVAFRAPNKEANAAALKTALEGIHNCMETSLDDEEEAFIVNQRHSNVLHWLNAAPERMITWNELLIWCCTDMNAEEMLKRFGVDACRAVDAAFRRLALGSEGPQLQKDKTKAYVWEPALVGAVLDHPNLPDELKANIRRVSGRYVDRLELSRRKGERKRIIATPTTISAPSPSIDEALNRPWEYLLPLEVAEIHPMSWSVFLSKWRQSADGKPDEEEDTHIYHQNGRRHHSVGEGANPSVLAARKNALVMLAHNPRIFHSFRDLNQLRQQLPLITNRPTEIKEDMSESSNRSRSLRGHQLTKAEERELEERRAQFRRLQQSSADLDELTRQRLQDKRAARNKAHENASEKRKQAELLAAERLRALNSSRRAKQANALMLSRRREHRWQRLLEVRQERHQRAQWWQQIQREAEIVRQEEFTQQLHRQRYTDTRPEENEHAFRSKPEPAVARMSTVALPRPPSTPPTSEQRRDSCPRRPLSARTSTADPQITRERAHVYGCAATKAFAARRPQTARADFFSGTRSPRARQSRRVRPEYSDDGRKDSSSVPSTTDASSKYPEEMDAANACETLVMTNAANEIAQQIAIPPVAAPAPEEDPVPPAIIMAQYLALEKEQRFKLHERYCVNRVSHKLTFAVLQQLTQEMRQDAAWREFLKAAGGPPGVNNSKRNKSKREAKVTYTAFVGVANQLGIPMPPKKLQAVARSLDPWKTGFVSWESFYSWWSVQ